MEKKDEKLRAIAMFAVISAVFSWIMLGIVFTPVSIGLIIWGFIEYARNGGPKMHYYALYAAIILILLKIPIYFFLIISTPF